MVYTLMHKHIPVMKIEIDECTYAISRIVDVYNVNHAPVGTLTTKGEVDRKKLHKWWFTRSIPMSRQGLKDAMRVLDIDMPQFLVEKCLALSLSDQYWIKPIGSDVRWNDVNFFTNDFSEDVGNVLFGCYMNSNQINLMSPNNTSDGYLMKKWKISNGNRVLIKGGNAPYYQEPFNEVFSSRIAQELGNIDYVSYSLLWHSDVPYSVCEDFIDEHTELVNASSIVQVRKKPNHVSEYQHFMDCCAHLGIPNVADSIDKMLTIDYLIANTDRHYNNFGAIRNAETLEWMGIAPIFDCGNSMWHDKPTSMINIEDPNSPSKTFKNNHVNQVKLVTSFDWLKFDKLASLENICQEVYLDNPFIDAYRKEKLCRAVSARIRSIL